MKKFFLIPGLLLMFLVAVLIFRPVPIVTEEVALVEKGIVDKVYESGVKDVVIILKGVKRRYYINRGLEQGLKLDELKSKLIGKQVTIKFPDYWTPLDWDGKVKHLSKLELGDKVIFNELK